jgi:hypothetical protein
VSATVVYRLPIAIRGCWLVTEWFFGWGAHARVNSFTLLHPYASLVADGVAVAFSLVILAGMWFFQRWARLIFVLLLTLALVISPFRVHYSFLSPPSFVLAIGVLVLVLTGAIVAMSFLPPVRDCFATKEG